MFRCTLGVILILLGTAILLVNGLPPTLAAAEENKCCNPAHAATPTTPAGGSTACFFNQMMCENAGACSGDAWQEAIEGACKDKQHANCYPGSASTSVTIELGYWDCYEFLGQCYCGFDLYSGEQADTDTVQDVENCTGSSC